MRKPPLPLGPAVADGEGLVEVQQARTIYDNFVRTDTYKLRTRKFDGLWSEPYERHVLSTGESGHAAAALLYDPARDVVVLIEQFRIINYLNQRPSAWNLEIVAGLIAAGDTPLDTIRREIAEESGRTAKRIEPIALFTSSPGVFTEMIHMFIAEVEAGLAGEVHGLAAEHENIRVHVLSYADALKLADEGWIDDAKTLLALNWFARKHEAIRHRWLNEK